MKYLALVLCSLFVLDAKATSCQPSVDSCGFYLCEEAQHQCGPQGYPLGFGFKFCQKFLIANSEYSPRSQAFLHNVRICLMRTLAQEDQGLTCDELKTTALGSHVGCYVDSGFCELSDFDKAKISWTMRDAGLYSQVRRNALVLAHACEERHPKTAQTPEAQGEPR